MQVQHLTIWAVKEGSKPSIISMILILSLGGLGSALGKSLFSTIGAIVGFIVGSMFAILYVESGLIAHRFKINRRIVVICQSIHPYGNLEELGNRTLRAYTAIRQSKDCKSDATANIFSTTTTICLKLLQGLNALSLLLIYSTNEEFEHTVVELVEEFEEINRLCNKANKNFDQRLEIIRRSIDLKQRVKDFSNLAVQQAKQAIRSHRLKEVKR